MGNSSSGNLALGNSASGNSASGNSASGNLALGNLALGNSASGTIENFDKLTRCVQEIKQHPTDSDKQSVVTKCFSESEAFIYAASDNREYLVEYVDCDEYWACIQANIYVKDIDEPLVGKYMVNRNGEMFSCPKGEEVFRKFRARADELTNRG